MDELIDRAYGQAGVLTGDNVRKLFDYAKENQVCVQRAHFYLLC